jgi:hypothetical protein
MTEELIDQLERAQPRFLLWSNRTFPEYGVSQFGVDFDRTLGAYFHSHYQPFQPSTAFGEADGWHASVWERKSGSQRK